MSVSPRLTRERRMTIVNGILVLVILIVIPAALAGLACFGLNAGLLRYLYHLE